ncbi:MAG: universal stress protein [Syntrophomonadaceae bacterium]|nr:universal stress protein [Syntrophomonadaceae bacterium]
MFKRIMVAYDEGKASDRALDAAIELAQATSGEIYIVSAYMTVDNPSRREYLEKLQTEAAKKVDQKGLTTFKKLEAGGKVLGETLARIADDLKADIVIMGSNNRGAVGRVVFGSVSDYLSHNLSCPVLIIK